MLPKDTVFIGIKQKSVKNSSGVIRFPSMKTMLFRFWGLNFCLFRHLLWQDTLALYRKCWHYTESSQTNWSIWHFLKQSRFWLHFDPTWKSNGFVFIVPLGIILWTTDLQFIHQNRTFILTQLQLLQPIKIIYLYDF